MLPILVIPFALGLGAMYLWNRRGEKKELPAPSPTVASGRAPSALSVLAIYMRDGQSPPPMVVQTAIAEAQTMGQMDLVAQILELFVIPVVREAIAQAPAPAAASEEPIDAELVEDSPSDDMARRSPSSVPPPSGDEQPSYDDLDSAGVDAMFAKDANGGESETMSGREVAAPIEGVEITKWQAFKKRLSREKPDFATERHVGQYRQRRERLRELGVDPDRGFTPDKQDRALERDLADSYAELKSAGDLGELAGKVIDVDDGEYPVTLSGVLGVVQVAGLEGAIAWFEHPEDRKRFPNTTKMFLTTNGVF